MSIPRWRTGKLKPEHFIELRDWMLVNLIPLYLEYGVVTDDEACVICLEDLGWNADAEPRKDFDARFDARTESVIQRVDDSPKGQAAAVFIMMAMQMRYLNMVIANTCAACIEKTSKWRADFIDFESSVLAADGYMRAMKAFRDVQIERSQSGAGKRREIGDRSRDKVAKEAERYRGKIAKDRAAWDIGEAVGMSPSRVRKLLSQLFPGKAWERDA